MTDQEPKCIWWFSHRWYWEPGDYSSSYRRTYCLDCKTEMPLWLEDLGYKHDWLRKMLGDH